MAVVDVALNIVVIFLLVITGWCTVQLFRQARESKSRFFLFIPILLMILLSVNVVTFIYRMVM